MNERDAIGPVGNQTVNPNAVHFYQRVGGHVLNGMDCWCMPTIVKMPGAQLVIHNTFAASVKPPKKEN